ncbi:MAG: MBL fold metallo-hydrolase [Thermodesulfovibrio sp.]|nr:MBL fold metallo-hydrolase [Thermodesulfovibrio sp.]MDW7972071.1 MBL fold metallo-hydrolase [Thermodesulfovibrio sp.]
MIDIRILFDNYEGEAGFKTGSGFSCFIKRGYGGILFDTGGDSEVLVHNLNKAEIKPSMITRVVLSYCHKDHTGGLKEILKLKRDFNIYAGKTCVENLINNEDFKDLNLITVDSEPVEIMNGVYLTGEIGDDIKEVSVVMDTGGGLVIITGCAHAGIREILKRAKEIVNEKIFALVGGFHLKDKREEEILDLIETLKVEGVKYIAPSHCTGDLARKLLKEAFQSGFIDVGAGTHIYIRGSCEYV